MFRHVMVGSNDLERSKIFYDALFAAMGGNEGIVAPNNRVAYMHNGGIFVVTTPIDGQPATPANGGTIAFSMDSPEQVDSWHDAGVENGGTSIEDPPGVREAGKVGTFYIAYLRDPDGNKICGIYQM